MKNLKFPLGAINRNSFDGSAHAFNIRLKDGALHPVDAPTETPVPFGVEYIHSAQDYKNLIGYKSDRNGTVVSFLGTLPASDMGPIRIGSFADDVLEVKHIGNTLIFLTSAGTQYFLFKNGTYRYLGSKIPMPRVQFGCTDFNGTTADDNISGFKERVYNSVYFANSEDSAIKYNYFRGAWAGKAEDITEAKNDITTDFAANFNKSIKEILDAGAIPEFPIQLRYAIRLYDGSYIYHSAPILVSQNAGLGSIVYSPTEISEGIRKGWNAPNKVSDDTLLENDWTMFPPEPLSGDIIFVDPGLTQAPDGSLMPLHEALAKLLDTDLNSTLKIPENKTGTSRLAIKVKSLMFKLIIGNQEELDRWKDIIDSIDIFISKQVTPYKIGELADFPNDDNLQVWYGYNKHVDHLSRDIWANFAAYYLRYAPYSNLPKQSVKEIHDAVASNSEFFLLKSISVYDGEYKKEEYKNGWVNLANEIHDHYAIIESQKQLPGDFTSHHEVSGKTAYIYNQSFHLGNTTTRLFKGFSPADLCVYCGNKGKYSNRGYITTTIEGSETKQATSVNNSADKGTFFISPLIFYPDANATKFEVAIADIANDTLMQGAFTAKPHEMITGAYFLTEDLTPITLNNGAQGIAPTQSVSPVINEPNRVIASGISNPFVFSSIQTNYVGNAEVIALCSATTALSQGQFGQFPLYVFCSDGIYALALNEQGVYSKVSPISYDIITNKYALAPTENSVIFATTQGVKLLHGSSTTSISDPLNGKGHNYFKGSAYENPYLNNFLKSICDSNYPDFNKSILDPRTEIHFDYANNEAWVVRPGTKYAYIFNLDSKSWSYRTFSADKFIPQYPHLYLRDNNRLLDVSTRNDAKLPMAIITNPIPTGVFAQYSDLLIDCHLFAKSFDCRLFTGNNPYRMSFLKRKHFAKDTPQIISGIHLSRIPLSTRFIQLAFSTDALDASFYSVSANVNPQPYNDKK